MKLSHVKFALLGAATGVSAAANTCYLIALISDLQGNLNDYLPYAAQIPSNLLNLALAAQTYTNLDYTTLITPGFPYDQVESIVTIFPWYSTRLSAELAAGDALCGDTATGAPAATSGAASSSTSAVASSATDGAASSATEDAASSVTGASSLAESTAVESSATLASGSGVSPLTSSASSNGTTGTAGSAGLGADSSTRNGSGTSSGASSVSGSSRSSSSSRASLASVAMATGGVVLNGVLGAAALMALL